MLPKSSLFYLSTLLIFLNFQLVSAQSKKELKEQLLATQTELRTLKDSLQRDTSDFSIATHQVSYAMAMNLAKNFKQQGFLDSLHIPTFLKAFYDVSKGEGRMSALEADPLIKTFINNITQKRTAALKREGSAFLAENKGKEGVITTESGLQYKVTQAGSGNTPGPTDRVKVHYEGKLIDGNIFDSSYERGEPIVLGVNRVIAGWTEALQLMKTGAKWTLYIPYNLAYGERGAGQDIPPYATLIFDIELLSIE